MRIILIFMAGILLLGGCAPLPAPPKIARIPIPVRCLTNSDIPARPPLASDSDLLAMDDRSFVLALARDRERLLEYAGYLEVAVQACIKSDSMPDLDKHLSSPNPD
jgi:hypothetical protein